MIRSCFSFFRSGQNHLARHSERGKKTRQAEEEVGRQHQGMDRPGVQQVPDGNGEQGKMEKTGCKLICSAPTTLAVKGLMMMMISAPIVLWSGTLVYRFARQTARKDNKKKKNLPSKNTMSSTNNAEFYPRNLQIAAYCILMSYFMESKLKKIPIDSL